MLDTTSALALYSKLYQRTCNQRCCCGQWLGLTEALLNHELCLDCQLRLSVDLVALTSKQEVRHAS
jgi:hypothetical protein